MPIWLITAKEFMNIDDSGVSPLSVSVCVWQDKHAEEVRKNKEMKEEACR